MRLLYGDSPLENAIIYTRFNYRIGQKTDDVFVIIWCGAQCNDSGHVMRFTRIDENQIALISYPRRDENDTTTELFYRVESVE